MRRRGRIVPVQRRLTTILTGSFLLLCLAAYAVWVDSGRRLGGW